MGRAALIVCAALLGAGSWSAQAGSYRVQAGDTLWEIARAHGVSVEALLDLNGRQGAVIRPGEVLSVPDGRVAAQARPVATIRATGTGAVGPGEVFQQGQAVYYGGRRDTRTAMTAAHLTLPFGTWVRVTHARTGRSVDVLINDRGPFGLASRVIDLSNEAAAALGILSEGVAPVTLSVLSRP
ncbi:hypothetical protein GCM10008937_30940 [Deinococcus depolymerans]|uniref:Probable endolytic peptidoglycan transglycosylase RlpA n=1 Tax=Deinococcus depolymerans TaxID=392408 RepID=A0ABN1CL37_9DEIO